MACVDEIVPPLGENVGAAACWETVKVPLATELDNPLATAIASTVDDVDKVNGPVYFSDEVMVGVAPLVV